MKNALTTRIADFLKNYPPFDQFSYEQLTEMSSGIRVRFCEEGEVIFRQGEPAGEHFFVVWRGAVALRDEREETPVLVDVADEGDVFGLRPLMAGDQYRLTAAVEEETLLYVVPNETFRPVVEADSRIAYILATVFASGGERGRASRALLYGAGGERKEDHRLIEVQTYDKLKKPVTCRPEETLRQAALTMSRRGVGSIIVVDEKNCPVGILTDTDLRNQVATGRFPLDGLVRDIMSSPVITIPPNQSVAYIQMAMIRHQVHHLCVTADGSADSPVQSVVSEHDLLVIQGNSPAILLREIYRSEEIPVLRQLRERAEWLLDDYLEQEVAISFISDVISQINDALIIRCVQMSRRELQEQGKPLPSDLRFCWLALGSEGREEQLLRTDQDSALIFADVEAEKEEGVKAKLLALARLVTEKLNALGFEYCPADMMASNPKWCLSQSDWRRQFAHWINSPGEEEVMYSNIFFDFRPIYGDKQLAAQLAEDIFELLEEKDIFLNYQARNALKNPPPLSFFRSLVLERNGEHKNEFDIKARAMMPLVDAARVLILQHRIASINNTFKRFEKLAELESQNSELFQQAADSYEILMRLRAMQGLKNNDSGRFFKPDDLNKMERLLLRNAFQPIDELQKVLRVRFRLSMLM